MRLGLAVSVGAGLGAASLRLPPLGPALAIAAFGLIDGLFAPLAGELAAPPGRRLATRAVSAALLSGVMLLLAAAHGSTRLASPWALPTCAIVATGAYVLGTFGALRPPNAAGPAIALLDLGTSTLFLLAALSAHEAPPSRRAVVALTLGVVSAARGLAVVTLLVRGARPGVALPAAGFVGWLAVAAVLSTQAATPAAWSGLGAAAMLTLAAVLVERRQRRAVVVFLRGALAFCAAAMLGAVSLLA